MNGRALYPVMPLLSDYSMIPKDQKFLMHEIRLKRLRYRAWRRGKKELDLVLGRFADRYCGEMSESELTAFERVLDCADPDLENWILKGGEISSDVDQESRITNDGANIALCRAAFSK
jgi:antitoxin CptB